MPHPVQRVPVSSANVLSYQFCPNCQGLYVEFRGNRLYKYAPVTADEWKSLRMAASKGSWIHFRLKETKRPVVDLGVDHPVEATVETVEVAASAG